MKKRSRRDPQQLIADLQAKIEAIRQRAERKKAQQDPALRHVAAALRALDRARAETKDNALKRILGEARELIASGSPASPTPAGAVPGPKHRRRPAAPAAAIEPAQILQFVKRHPGLRCEDIATGLSAESPSVSPVLKTLRDAGKLRTEGQARGTRYFVGR